MKMEELIEKVSDLYREERRKLYDIKKELQQVESELYDADYNGGENITFARYKELTHNRESLKQSYCLKEHYCEGISSVREMLMDFGFDEEIK